jgi:aldose 1-epimerase
MHAILGKMTIPVLLLAALAAAAAPYSARRISVDGVPIVRLEDTGHNTSVSIVPSIGNIAYEMSVNGVNLLRFPYPSVAAFQASPRICGIPLLAPWADRLDEPAFYANGKRYAFNRTLGNIDFDRNGHPIHGFLSLAAGWQVTRLEAGPREALVTSRLDVSARPEWMAQFPFAHVIEMTYVLSDGVLEVRTRIENKSREAMPVSIGYHSFFQLTDAPRADWRAGLGAKREWPLNGHLLPTGETRPLGDLVGTPENFVLGNRDFDYGFDTLIRDAAGRASFWIQGKRQKIEVLFGPKFIAGEIYSPGNSGFLCFEPMAAINNGLNLAHRGIYKELQTIPPGQAWQESFWVRPSGY